MQRTYDGVFCIKMSTSKLRLFLNWVAAVTGRFFESSSDTGKHDDTMAFVDFPMASFKSRKRRSLFLSRNPSTVYLQEVGEWGYDQHCALTIFLH